MDNDDQQHQIPNEIHQNAPVALNNAAAQHPVRAYSPTATTNNEASRIVELLHLRSATSNLGVATEDDEKKLKMREGNERLKAEREKSICFVQSGSETCHDECCNSYEQSHLFETLPAEVLDRIVDNLDLRDRVMLSQVSRHLNNFFVNCVASPLRNVIVLNLFEKRVWDTAVKKNSVSRSRIAICSNVDGSDLHTVFLHIRAVDTLKLWFHNSQFVTSILETVLDFNLKSRTVDLYPYGMQGGLEEVHDLFPQLTTMTLRPHGAHTFWNGLLLERFPIFANMTTLCMDSFAVGGQWHFPPNLRTLDYSHRRMSEFNSFIQAVSECSKLEFLSVSHFDFSAEQFGDFLRVTCSTNMPLLHTLYFKFCQFSFRWDYNADSRWRLRTLVLDHSGVSHGLDALLDLTERTLGVLSVNVVVEENATVQSVLNICPRLLSNNVKLYLSLMQRNDTGTRFGQHNDMSVLEIPHAYFEVITKFEASFVHTEDSLLKFFDRPTAKLTDAKFIKCSALDDKCLKNITMWASGLGRLTMISCPNIRDEYVMFLVGSLSWSIVSTPLQVLYKPDNGNLVTLFGELLLNAGQEKSIAITHSTKTLPDSSSARGELIIYEDQKLKKSLIIKNYHLEDLNRIIGLVINLPSSEEESVDNGPLNAVGGNCLLESSPPVV